MAVAQTTTAPSTTGNQATELETIEVTGSRIRRTDIETSNTVQVIDRSQIEATGTATLEELLQAIPSMEGTPGNTQNNNGPAIGPGSNGVGEAYVDLRGLAPKRTLILLDGQRLNNNDLNAIPVNMIERVEVLKEGAGAVYGTDAIGGVVNFITRKNFTGFDAAGTWGKTQRNDGNHNDVQLTFGQAFGSGGSALLGFSTNRQSAINAGDRPSSATAMGLYYGITDPNAWTSSRGPYGRYKAGLTLATDPRCPSATGTSTMLTPGSAISTSTFPSTTAGEYRGFCNNFAPGYTDRYNYQPENWTQIPSQHWSFFGGMQHPFTDTISGFLNASMTSTRAQAKLAAEPFDYVTIEGVFAPAAVANPNNPTGVPVVSSLNAYNPFGTDIKTFYRRPVFEIGDRVYTNTTNSYQLTGGVKGMLMDRFNWDTDINYGRYDNRNEGFGTLDFTNILAQLGPSARDAGNNLILDVNGKPMCSTDGTQAGIIPGCESIDLFGGTNLASVANTIVNATTFDEMDISGNVSGDLVSLPAGPLGLAVGAEYRTLSYHNMPDAIQQVYHESEGNGLPTQGGYNAKEVYAELGIPIVGNLPGIESLRATIGGRFSHYSSFGDHTAGKYALEYRPYSDLMLRGTYADVYRAPTTTELFLGPTQGAPSFSDPCKGLTTATHPIACAGVPQNGSFAQTVTQGNANSIGNPNLQPEVGHSIDYGFVFNPSFYKPVSLTLDRYEYTLHDAIDFLSLQTVLNACFADETSPFCGNAINGQPYFTRDPNTGQLVTSTLPEVNGNQYKIRGLDASFTLSYPGVTVGGMNMGNFKLGIEGNYLEKYEKKIEVGGSVIADEQLAGLFDSNDTVGSYPHFRALSYLSWGVGPVKAIIQDRYISTMHETAVDFVDVFGYGACGTGAGFNGEYFMTGPTTKVYCYKDTGYANYLDLAGTYSFMPFNTDFTVGVNDLFDHGANRMYNAALAGAANPLYDNRGRNFYGRLTIHFK